MASSQKSSSKPKKTSNLNRSLNRKKKTSNKNTYVRVAVLFGVIGVLLGGFLIYDATAPKVEKSASASELIANVANAAKLDSSTKPSLQTGFAIKRAEGDKTLTSSKEKTVVWMSAVPETNYDATKANIDDYFTKRSYEKRENGASGAGISINYDGDKFSCRVDDWGASTNGSTGVNEKNLLVACASVDDFNE